MSKTSATAAKRSSNIELLRIVAMLLVVASHFQSASGLPSLYENFGGDVCWNKLWAQCFGLWGKTVINVFVVITGYFMCTGALTVRRFLKIFLEMEFYNFAAFFVLLPLGYETITAKRLFELLFWPFSTVNRYFGESFLWFYLFIPFYNVFIRAATKRQHLCLVGLLLLMFTATSSFFFNKYVFHHVFWYASLYFLAAAIRLYPMEWMASRRCCGLLLAGGVALACAWAVGVDFIQRRYNVVCLPHNMFVYDSHKILAVEIAVSAFLVFRNMSIPYSRLINAVAATTFGVFLIHTASDGMRRMIWTDILGVKEHFLLPTWQFVLYSLASVAGVFATCSVIDWFRIRYVETPFFAWLFPEPVKAVGRGRS